MQYRGERDQITVEIADGHYAVRCRIHGPGDVIGAQGEPLIGRRSEVRDDTVQEG